MKPVKDILIESDSNKISRVGSDPRYVQSDFPINWDAPDLGEYSVKWDIDSIRNFSGLSTDFTAIYPTILNVDDLIPQFSQQELKFGKWKGYNWKEFEEIRSGFPPILVMRKEDGNIVMMDGNHRVEWAKRKNLKTIGAWVVDKLLQKEINTRNKLTETRIIEPDQSLHEGYITLYHGTIWPIALKSKKGQLGPQELRELVTDILVKVFKESPQKANEYFDKHSGGRKNDPKILYLTTSKEGAENYARSSTKYGGEIFHDVLSSYMWDKHMLHNRIKVLDHLKTNEPALVTMNVPLSMVLTHPNWNTPLRARLRSILSPINREKYKHIWDDITDLRLEVFVKEKIPARFIQRIDKVGLEDERIDKISSISL